MPDEFAKPDPRQIIFDKLKEENEKHKRDVARLWAIVHENERAARMFQTQSFAEWGSSHKTAAFPWPILIPVLVELFKWIADCVNPDDGADAKRKAEAAWDTAAQKYDERDLRRVARLAKRAAKKQGKRLTSIEADAYAVTALDSIRHGDEQQMSLVIRECEREPSVAIGLDES